MNQELDVRDSRDEEEQPGLRIPQALEKPAKSEIIW